MFWVRRIHQLNLNNKNSKSFSGPETASSGIIMWIILYLVWSGCWVCEGCFSVLILRLWPCVVCSSLHQQNLNNCRATGADRPNHLPRVCGHLWTSPDRLYRHQMNMKEFIIFIMKHKPMRHTSISDDSAEMMIIPSKSFKPLLQCKIWYYYL